MAESDLSGNLQSEYVFFDGERVARKDFPSGAHRRDLFLEILEQIRAKYDFVGAG